MSFGVEHSEQEKCGKAEVEKPAEFLTQPYFQWYDPANWMPRKGGMSPIPHEEQIPCRYDKVIIPKDSAPKVIFCEYKWNCITYCVDDPNKVWLWRELTITKRICPCNFTDINKPLGCRHFKIGSRRKRLFYCGVRRPLHGRTLPAVWNHDVSGQQVVDNSSGLVSNTNNRVYVRKRGEEHMPASRRIQLPTSCLFW